MNAMNATTATTATTAKSIRTASIRTTAMTIISRRARRRRGSAVLLLCVIAVPMILILATLLQGARHQSDMLDVERALTAQVQTRLSGFDKDLFDEFGLLALAADARDDAFARVLPTGIRGLKPVQTTSEPLSEPDVLKASILDFMRLRLPATMLKTIMDQTGIGVKPSAVKPSFAKPSAVKPSVVKPTAIFASASTRATILPAGLGIGADLFASTVGDAFSKLLSDAIYKVLDAEIKEALDQYRSYAADCIENGEGQDLVAFPNLFDPEQLGSFTELLGSALTVPSSSLYNRLALREYILTTFWPAGQPSQSITAAGANIRLSGDHLEFRNLSGSPLKSYSGRQAGEVEQILTGAKTPKTAISQVKAIMVVYRAALFIGRKLLSDSGIAGYQAGAALLAAAIAAASGVVIEPNILAYVLLACDGLRQGFSDYSRLMKGERLAFTAKPGSAMLSLDYAMHLRILLLLSPEKQLLQRTGTIIAKRHGGVKATRITVSCAYLGQIRTRTGSLRMIGATS